jgi:bacterioferritin-associated ferredoxin|tara:strand:+ start:672 stop:818 length:147 start_codon:yes stop_codon:yes gene_type:complete
VDALRADFGLASNCGQCLTHALDMIDEVQAQQGERYAGAQRIIALAQA